MEKRERLGVRAGATFSIVGSVMGAGFISGRELIEFFGGFFLPRTIAATGCFLFFFLLFFRLGAKYGGFSGVLKNLFGAFALPVKALILFGGFVTAAGMLSAVNELLPRGGVFSAFLLLLLACLIGGRGVKGLGVVNAILTPAVLLGVVFLAVQGGRLSPPEPTDGEILPFLGVLLYVGMNAFLSMPVLCDLGWTLKKGGVGVCGGAAILIGGAIGLILSVLAHDKCSYSKALPLFYVLGGSSAVFSALSFGGIATTLFSSFYPLYRLAGVRGGAVGKTALVGLTFAASFVSFKRIVGEVYPAFGVTGACVFFYALVREGLWRFKRRKKPAALKGRRVF
ncbi:MAG: hypothetical protein IJY62_02000 [Clostridia bacterium]|nr:hypothetical protein [Clostridia bacterium]